MQRDSSSYVCCASSLLPYDLAIVACTCDHTRLTAGLWELSVREMTPLAQHQRGHERIRVRSTTLATTIGDNNLQSSQSWGPLSCNYAEKNKMTSRTSYPGHVHVDITWTLFLECTSCPRHDNSTRRRLQWPRHSRVELRPRRTTGSICFLFFTGLLMACLAYFFIIHRMFRFCLLVIPASGI